jgi:FkbM family methyltransferase
MIIQTLQGLAAKLGLHVVRNHRNPSHTLMGLGRFDFETVLDVGANSGQFAQEMRPRFPRATFHCFEPGPTAFKDLSAWAMTQRNVLPVQLAIGDKPGRLDLNVHTDHTTSSSLLATTSHKESLYPFVVAQSKVQVRMATLDHYISELAEPLRGQTLLKLDVQGYETPALRGATQTLSKVRACIVEVNIDELYEGQSRFADIVQLMSAAGLDYAGNFNQEFATDGHVIFLDAVFVRPTAEKIR